MVGQLKFALLAGMERGDMAGYGAAMTQYKTRIRSGGEGAGSRTSLWRWKVVDPGPPMVSIASGETTGAESGAYEAAAPEIERHQEMERRRTPRAPKRPRHEPAR